MSSPELLPRRWRFVRPQRMRNCEYTEIVSRIDQVQEGQDRDEDGGLSDRAPSRLAQKPLYSPADDENMTVRLAISVSSDRCRSRL